MGATTGITAGNVKDIAGAVSGVAQIGGVVLGAKGARDKSKADKQAYEYQAGVLRNNEQVAEWRARDAIERGKFTQNTARLKNAALRGSQRARLAANNVALDEGSALNILDDTEYLGDLDAATIADNAANEAWGYRVGAANDSANAELLSRRSANERPNVAAATSLLSGVGTVADSWYNRANSGLGSKD